MSAQAAAPIPKQWLPAPRRPRHPAVWLHVRGRRLKLRGLKQPPTGLLRWVAILGPGLVAATAGDDAGGIATYSQAGAQFGYDLLWVLLLITLSLAVVQETAARLGAASGRGLLDLVRERFGMGWALFVIGVVLVANSGIIVAEFVGIGAAAELLGYPRAPAILAAALLVWTMVVRGSYSRVEKLFVVMALVFLAYPMAAVLAHPDWGEVARGAFVPSVRAEPVYLSMLVAMIGTTITPYMQLFQQSALVDKQVGRRHYGPERADAYTGAVFSNLVAGFIVIATAATLHAAGTTDVQTAEDAARALEPATGGAASTLFAVGLLGASLLAAGVLPLATAYAVSEAFGFRRGVSLDYRRAAFFQGCFTALIVLGALLALIPGVPVIDLLVGTQILNGVLLPVVLVFLLLLANDPLLAGHLKNGWLNNVLGWGTVAMVTTAVVAMFGMELVQAMGLVGGAG